MIILKDWETEETREFESVATAKVWALSKLVQRYIKRIGHENIEQLIKRLGIAVEVIGDTKIHGDEVEDKKVVVRAGVSGL